MEQGFPLAQLYLMSIVLGFLQSRSAPVEFQSQTTLEFRGAPHCMKNLAIVERKGPTPNVGKPKNRSFCAG
jgi:hypothetical protein